MENYHSFKEYVQMEKRIIRFLFFIFGFAAGTLVSFLIF